MKINDSLLTYNEKLVYSLKDLYSANGYRLYKMSRFEEYDFYAENKDFLVSDQVLTFTDGNGKLMALKPDVTLSIARNRKEEDHIDKVFYNENIYRFDPKSGSFKEILQTGVECFGDLDSFDLLDTILLALSSMEKISDDFLLVLSDLDLSKAIIQSPLLSENRQKELFAILKEKKVHELEPFYNRNGRNEKQKLLMEKLMACIGRIDEVYEVLNELYELTGIRSSLSAILSTLKEKGYGEKIVVDTSLIDDINYYNGIIFKGYLTALTEPVLSGGQYDRLMEKLSKKSKAIGFAVYTGLLEEETEVKDDGYLNIALPKGRLGQQVYALFEKAGYECPEVLSEDRRLVFENQEKKLRYFWVKPSDVAVYVERGTADIGVAGKDILAEFKPAVYELLDLKKGRCRMAVAARKDFEDHPYRTLKVATKFANIANAYYRSIGRDIDIIHLNGSIEIAPVLGLSDVIVDIVETGRTLKENGLEVKEEIMDISARLIANRSSYEFKTKRIQELSSALEKEV